MIDSVCRMFYFQDKRGFKEEAESQYVAHNMFPIANPYSCILAVFIALPTFGVIFMQYFQLMINSG